MAPALSESKLVLCGTHFLPQDLTVDHIVARSNGGTDHLGNLQLICGHCNSMNGDRAVENLRAGLVRAVCAECSGNQGFAQIDWNVAVASCLGFPRSDFRRNPSS